VTDIAIKLLLFRRRFAVPEDHRGREQEQYDSAGNLKGLKVDIQTLHQHLSTDNKQQQDHACYQRRPYRNEALLCGAEAGGHRQKHWNGPDGINNDPERDEFL
tara:strand:+ start:757 stop:1065 length:309 start_codon:yes stop_codon:yes gene_type:complete